MATIIIGVFLAAAIALSVFVMARRAKNGSSCSGCDGCPGCDHAKSCHSGGR